MKKLLLTFAIITIISCDYKPDTLNKYNKYEVLLSSHDTIYIEAYDYGRRHDTYIFREQNCKPIVEIVNPIYIKQIKDR